MTVKKETRIHRYIGLSTDTKPTGSTVELGSTFLEYDTNDTYITPDNTSWYIKDSKSVKRVSATYTLSAAVAYGSGDVMSNSSTPATAVTIDFASIAGYAGGTGQIVNLLIHSNDNTPSAEPVLYFFTTSSPASAKIDNDSGDAPVHADVSTGVYVNRVQFSKMVTLGSGADSTAFPVVSTLPVWFTTSSTDSGLHAIMETATAATFASKELIFDMWVRRS